MERGWNPWPVGGFLVTVAAFLSYFFFFANYPITRDVPWVNLVLFAAGLGLLGVGLKRGFREPARLGRRVGASTLAVLSVGILGLFLFYNFSFSSQLPSSKEAPRVGQETPDFTLPDTDGKLLKLSELLAERQKKKEAAGKEQWLLLVFYRGYW
jgi:hypothetical protein